MTFVAIDFEASCLPRDGRSFPIEVAISGIEGTRSWLIRPAPQWHDWCWTEDAGRLHGIPRPIIEHEGRAPATVLTELGAAIAGRRVFADSSLDADWLATLAAAAGRAASFRIEHASLFVDPLRAKRGRDRQGPRLRRHPLHRPPPRRTGCLLVVVPARSARQRRRDAHTPPHRRMTGEP